MRAMKGVVVLLFVVAVLVGSSHALKKRSGSGADQPPTLELVEVPDIDIKATSNATVDFTVSSGTSKVAFVGVMFGNDTYKVADARWNATSSTANQSVTLTLPLTIYHVVTGIFDLSVTVCDLLNDCDTYSSDDLNAAGLQYSAVIFTNVVSISCPSTPLSVLDGDCDFTCTLNIWSDPYPVVAYNVYAMLSNAQTGVVISTVYPDDGSFDDPDATDQSVSADIDFTLPQYAANGTYVVTAEASGPNYLYDTAFGSFIVKAEINDLLPPTLKSINAPTITLPANTNTVVVDLVCTDDAVGCKSVDVEIPGLGSGTWTSSNDQIGSDTSVSISVPITVDISKLVSKLYFITLTLCDKSGKCITWATSDLVAANLQSTLNIGPVDPNGSKATLSCGGPYDVANGPVTVTCTYTVTFVTGIYTYTVFVSRDLETGTTGPTFNAQASPGYYYDAAGSQITQTSSQTFTLPQYAPYGNYTVLGTAYNADLSTSVVGTATVVVLKTTNDMGPPTLRTLSVPVPANINSFQAKVSANDDASGVASISVYLFGKGSTGVGTANTTLTNNNRVITNIIIPIVMNVYNASESIFFAMEVMLIDVLGNKLYYSTTDLASDGFQANVTLKTPSVTTTTTTSTTSTDSGVALAVSLPYIIMSCVFVLLINSLFA